jgi:hypothetical protein
LTLSSGAFAVFDRVAAVPDIRKLNINGMFSLVLAGGKGGTGISTFGIGGRLSE